MEDLNTMVMNNKNSSNEKKKLPLEKMRVGGVSVTFWENNGENGEYCTCTIERSYKDKKGEWQTTNSYSSNDLDKLDIALQQARHYASVTYPQSKKTREENVE